MVIAVRKLITDIDYLCLSFFKGLKMETDRLNKDSFKILRAQKFERKG